MDRKPPASPGEFLELLQRRRYWVLVPMLVIPVLVFFVGLRLPKQYRSQTVILVDPQKISSEYVKSAVVSDVTDRLQTIKEEVMSRTRLEHIADELGLYPEKRKKGDVDAVIASMQKDISVEIIKGSNDHNPVDGFKIAYIASTPMMAQQVTQRIAELFIQENLRVRAQQAMGTNDFIAEQMQKAKADLDAQEQKIRDFKSAHMGSLPEQESSNLTLISQTQSLTQANSEAIDRANQERVYLQSMLNMNGSDKSGAGVTVAGPLEIQLQQKRDQLAAAQQKYTDSHPDVIRLKAEVAQLEQQVENAPKSKSMRVGPGGPSVSQQLQGQLVAIQQEIKSRTQKQAQLEGQLRALQGRVELLPAVQGEFESLQRDYLAMQKNYESLAEKQQASGMATALEQHDDSESFRVLDPASAPHEPYSPDLLLVNAGGLVGGIAIGVLLAVAMDLRDATIHSPEEASRYLDLPLIVALPSLDIKKQAVERAPWQQAG